MGSATGLLNAFSVNEWQASMRNAQNDPRPRIPSLLRSHFMADGNESAICVLYYHQQQRYMHTCPNFQQAKSWLFGNSKKILVKI